MTIDPASSPARLPASVIAGVERLAEIWHRRFASPHEGPGNLPRRSSYPPGLTALIAGLPSDETLLSARTLADRLGKDLYRVDLAATANRYLSETEPALTRLMSHAEGFDVVLLLDEGDALFCQPTGVQSGEDRYSSADTSYVLQRLAEHRGLTLVGLRGSHEAAPELAAMADLVIDATTAAREPAGALTSAPSPINHQAVDAAVLAVIDLLRANCGPGGLCGHELDFVVYQAADFHRPIEAGVSMYVYGLSPEALTRSCAWPVGAPGSAARIPPLAVTAHILLSAWAPDAALEGAIAAWVMGVLHQFPVLRAGSGGAPGSDSVAGPQADAAGDLLEIRSEQLPLADLIALGKGLNGQMLPLSMGYAVKGIRLIE